MNTSGKTNALTKQLKIGSLPVASTSQVLDADLVNVDQELNGAGIQFWKPFQFDQFWGADRKDWPNKIHNLLLDLDEISELFRFELKHRSWLNVFLLAAGMSQIVEDYLSDTGNLGKATNVVKLLPRPIGEVFFYTSNHILQFWMNFKQMTFIQHKIQAWNNRIELLTSELADELIRPTHTALRAFEKIIDDGEVIFSEEAHLPHRLRKEIIRLPSCFLSFDQQIEDLQRIIDNFSTQWPDRNKVISVIGIRTSGSYLGPVYAAILKSYGYTNVSLVTFRPGKTISHSSSVILKQLVENNGLALVCDDPPISGTTVRKTAETLEDLGLPTSNIILLMQLFGDPSSIPAMLTKYPAIIFSKLEWNIQQFLEPNNVCQVLAQVCSDFMGISEVERVPYENNRDERQHVHAQYNVTLVDRRSGEFYTRTVLVKGIGLGYYAEHALSVSQTLSSFAAKVITVQNGLIYLDLGGEARPLATDQLTKDSIWKETILRYIIERNHKLALHKDISLSIYGRNAAWEVASNILSNAFLSGWWLARLAFIDTYVKDMLTPSKPSVIDGDMGHLNWFIENSMDKHFVKVHLTERDFSHKDLFSADPAFDLASLAQEIGGLSYTRSIRRSYETFVNEKVSSERWMLFQLVRLWDFGREEVGIPGAVTRKMEKVVQEYFSDVFFSELIPANNGPVCTLDIDGVLETNQLGFASLTKSSAQSLRALILHGFRILLATGRSLPEVKNRCEAYNLAGGVAEYGSVIYDAENKTELPLVTSDEQITLETLRSNLARLQGVWIDADYKYSIRAYSIGKDGKRKGIDGGIISQVLKTTDCEDKVSAVEGNSQTDFVLSRINKARGIKQWLTTFAQEDRSGHAGGGNNQPILFAVGDTLSDIQMLRMAALAYAPAHANLNELSANLHITQKPYQAGFEQAVTELLGHKPGTCPLCKGLTLQPETKFMLDLLSVQEGGPANMVNKAISLSANKVRKLNVS